MILPPSWIQGDAPNFGIVQGIFVGSAVVYTIILALVDPENHGGHFESGKMAFQAGASKEDVNSILEEVDGVQGDEKWGEGNEQKGRLGY